MQAISQCLYCKNMLRFVYNPITNERYYTCKAFKKIPVKYLGGKPHNESDGHDNGVIFKPNYDKKGLLKQTDIPILVVREDNAVSK